MLKLYLFGLHFTLAEVATAARVDVARVENIFAAMLALQRLNDFHNRLSHFLKQLRCGSAPEGLRVDGASSSGYFGNSIVMAVHVPARGAIAGGRSAALDAQS